MYEYAEVERSRIWTFCVGALAGAAIGVMLAPQEGRKTRRRLARSIRECSPRALRRLRHDDRLVRRAAGAAGRVSRSLRRASVTAALAVLPRRVLARLA